MLRALMRVILVVVILVAAAAFFLGYRWGGGRNQATTAQPAARQETAVGTRGDSVDTARERARAAGAEIGDKVAVGAQKAGETLDEAGLTAKVKSKIALDDTLDGARVKGIDQRQPRDVDRNSDQRSAASPCPRLGPRNGGRLERRRSLVGWRAVGYSSVRTYSLPLMVNALIQPSFSPAGSFQAGEILKL